MKTVINLFILAAFFFAGGCNKDENPSTPAISGTAKITVSHLGIDWSTQKTGAEVDYTLIDGETIGWCEPGTGGGTGIWFRTFNNKIYRVGNVELASVTKVDETKWQTDVCATPLANGDVWVVQAHDGYVKFKVINQGDPAQSMWEVEVEFKYSSNINF